MTLPISRRASKENTDYRVKRFLKMFDANKDGKVSKEEFEQRAKDRFAMRDLNSDGAIDLDDMGPGMRDGMRDRAGRRAEQPKDGKEGAEAKEPRRFTLDRLLGRTDRRFARLDKNGDGVIDAKDFETAAAERVDFATKRFLKRFDANGDGKVSKDEFERFAKERFADARPRRRRQDHGSRPAAEDARHGHFEVSSGSNGDRTCEAAACWR